MCCISLNMHILQSLLRFKIFIMKIPKDSHFIFLILNAFFITVYHFKAVRVDIFTKFCIASHSVYKDETSFFLYIFFIFDMLLSNQNDIFRTYQENTKIERYFFLLIIGLFIKKGEHFLFFLYNP